MSHPSGHADVVEYRLVSQTLMLSRHPWIPWDPKTRPTLRSLGLIDEEEHDLSKQVLMSSLRQRVL